MKKIVGILAAAAVLATSVFAADVSAKVRVTGELFNYDGSAEAFKAVRAATVSNTYDAPYATLSVSEDKSGATVKFVTGGDGTEMLKVGDVQVWFKPFDQLKVICGSQDIAMNKETIDWTSTNSFGTFGYNFNITVDAFSANIALGTDNNGWFYSDGTANGTKEAFKNVGVDKDISDIKDLYANFAYAADFGKISAMFEYKGKTFKIDDKGNFSSNKNDFNPSTIKYGLGYNNTIDSLTFFVDAIGTTKLGVSDDVLKNVYIEKTLTGASLDAFVQYAKDALTAKGYVKAEFLQFNELGKDAKGNDYSLFDNNNFQLCLKARVDYKLDNFGIYAYFGSGNLLKKAVKAGDTDESSVFESTIKLGATTNFGACNLETWLQLDTGKGDKYNKINVSMPIYFQVGF